ncbi:GEM-like protein 1 [Dendrobium catenatum]|uniref:GEM-like protein 1 n=1 Tax=Dendrobium catenatum TaxID=906689 RepID=A0A2I0VWD0_9ASPA|nr:GEM-like protein 1 [Dendrobium catenatum]
METPTDHSAQKTTSASAGEGDGASTGGQSVEYAPYPKIGPTDVQPPPPPPSSSSPKSVSWSSDLVKEAHPNTTTWDTDEHETISMPVEGNPYITPAPASSKNTMESVKEVLGKWGMKLGETAKKTEDFAGNFWQHCISNWYQSTFLGPMAAKKVETVESKMEQIKFDMEKRFSSMEGRFSTVEGRLSSIETRFEEL